MSVRPHHLLALGTRFPRSVIAVAVLLAVLAIWFTSARIEFYTGRDQLMPANTAFNRDYQAYRAEFGDQEEIVAVIEAGDSELAGRFGERLASRLAADTAHFREVFFPFSLPLFKKSGLLFMPVADLEAFTANLTRAAPTLRALAAAPSVQTLFSQLTSEMQAYLQAPAAPGAPQRLDRLVFMLGALGEGIDRFATKGDAGFSFEDVFMRRADGSLSGFAAAGRQQVLTVLPVKDGTSFVPAAAAIERIRAEIAQLGTLPEFRGVTVGLTGTPVLEHEEMSTSKRDIELATGITVLLTVVLLLVAFRGLRNTIAAMIALLIAIALSFGFATLAVGHLNILSMVFAVMLIGIGIEYGIQVVLRRQEEAAHGALPDAALSLALASTFRPVVMAAATVAAAFVTFAFTDFKGIAELGIIAAGGIAICVLVTFTVLPALLTLGARKEDRGTRHEERGTKLGVNPSLEPRTSILDLRTSNLDPGSSNLVSKFLFSRPKLVVLVTALLAAAAVYPASRVGFDYNLLHLQARGLESVAYAQKLMRSKENAGYFAVVTARDRDEAAALTQRLAALPTVDQVTSLLTFVPDRQEEKLRLLARARESLAGLKAVPYEEDLRLMELPAVFETFRTTVEQLQQRLAADTRPEAKPVGTFLALLDRFFAQLEKEKDRNAVGMLKQFQGGMLADLPGKLQLLAASLRAAPVTAADVPTELQRRFVGKTGQYLLQVAPRGEIFDREPLAAFLNDVRRVAPHATGEPVMVHESMTVLRDSYQSAFAYASVAIAGILLLAFRSLRYALIGLVPLVVGLLFMMAGMGVCDISFNSANIIVLPLLLGIAVDSGIYLISRYRREDETPGQVTVSSTGVGVFLNTLTIMASFGALMVARHQGVFSIGAVMSLGMLACQFACVLVLPATLNLWGDRRRDQR
jgi:hopanoid biosynthesis associated RND transporter like protein HpnN